MTYWTDPETDGVYGSHPKKQPRYSHDRSTNGKAVETQASIVIDLPETQGLSDRKYQKYLDMISKEHKDYLDAFKSGGSGNRGYFQFLLQNATEPKREKVQVTETLSDAWVAHFFGETARSWSYNGTLFNTRQDRWYDAWSIIYDEFLRGTKLAETGLLARLSYNGKHVYGALTSTQTSLSADNEAVAPFNFNMLVADVQRDDLPEPQLTNSQIEETQSSTTRYTRGDGVEGSRRTRQKLTEGGDEDDFRSTSGQADGTPFSNLAEQMTQNLEEEGGPNLYRALVDIVNESNLSGPEAQSIVQASLNTDPDNPSASISVGEVTAELRKAFSELYDDFGDTSPKSKRQAKDSMYQFPFERTRGG